MIRFAICDDEPIHIDILVDELEDAMGSYSLDYEILTFRSSRELLQFQEGYHILFLDIRLENGNDGIALGKMLMNHPAPPIVILVSSLEDRVVDGYHINALRYLVKPLKRAGFREALAAAIAKLSHSPERLVIRYKNETQYIPVDQILYIETFRGKRKIETKTGSFQTNEQLAELAARLPPNRFYPVNRSYCVSFAAIRSAGKNIVLTNGLELSIARGKRTDFFNALHTFMGGRLQ